MLAAVWPRAAPSLSGRRAPLARSKALPYPSARWPKVRCQPAVVFGTKGLLKFFFSMCLS